MLRSSLLSGGIVALMALSGTWQYFASTLYAHDIKRTAAWSDLSSTSATPSTSSISKQPVLVLIDDKAYDEFFRGQSPLPRDALLQLLKTIAQNTSDQTRIALDLDVSPATNQEAEQAELDAYFQSQPQRWVLSAVKFSNPDTSRRAQLWQERLCTSGVSFGLPYLPTEFGYSKLTHQYQNGLASVVLASSKVCADPFKPYQEVALPMQGLALSSGLSVSFNGDLQALGQTLKALGPKVVVLGGAWGQSDVFGTPFGERFGVQLHTAAIAAGMNHEFLAPNWAEILLVWVFVSLLSTLLGFLSLKVAEIEGGNTASLAGLLFFKKLGKPALFIVMTLLLLIGLSEVLALLHVHFGIWLSSSKVGCITLGTMLLTWDWGRTAPVQYDSFMHTWQEVVAQPVRRDFQSIKLSAQIIVGTRKHWAEERNTAQVTKPQALTECLLALVSLISQTALPLGSLIYAISQPV